MGPKRAPAQSPGVESKENVLSKTNYAPYVRSTEILILRHLGVSFARAAVMGTVVLGLAAAGTQKAGAQLSIEPPAMLEVATASLTASAVLPDAPGFSSSASEPTAGAEGAGSGQKAQAPGVAGVGRYAKTVEPGQSAPRLTVGNKVALGFIENVSFTSFAGWLISAGYEQATNGSPNYGEGGKPFAQRFGAAAARNSSQNVISDSIIAPILHLDPRYYRLGPDHKFVNRVLYSGTRGLITKTDGGKTTINFANIGGDLGGSALTQLYYPPGNRNIDQVMQTWGTSIGGDAIGYVVSEFLPDVLAKFHHK